MMLDRFVGVVLTHRSIPASELGEVFKNVHTVCMNSKFPIFVLHTCNRVEVYSYDVPEEFIHEVVEAYRPYTAYVEVLRGKEAARHLFRVAAGLDSMLIGETDVLGQLEEAFDRQVRAGYTRGLLKTIVEKAIQVGKRAHTVTNISRGPRGLGALSLVYLQKRFDLKQLSFCIIGAGAVGRGIVKMLRDLGVRDVVVVNRTVEKAREWALSLGVEVWPLNRESVERCLKEFDVVYTVASSLEPIIVEVPAGARVKCIVDLGVPRNTARGLPVEVIDIDVLRPVAEEFNRERMGEVGKVEKIIEEESERLEVLLRRKWAELELGGLLERWFKIAEEEGGRAGGGLAVAAAKSTVKRILLPLVNVIKSMAENGEFEKAEELISLLKYVENHASCQ